MGSAASAGYTAGDMSYDAWGDDDGHGRELPDGCWDEVTVSAVQEAIRDLTQETVYEDGDMSKGIGVRFLARLTVLRAEANLLSPNDPLYREAVEMLRGEAV